MHSVFVGPVAPIFFVTNSKTFQLGLELGLGLEEGKAFKGCLDQKINYVLK